MYTNKWMCVCNVLCEEEYGEKANIFSSACDSLYSEIIQCKHTTMYAWKSSEAKTKRWKSIIVPKKKGKFSLFMTFNFSLYPSYHTIHVFIHISVAANVLWTKLRCLRCFFVVSAQSLKTSLRGF